MRVEPHYGQLSHAVNEEAVVDEGGILHMPWPNMERGGPVDVDLILATATSPTLIDGRYPLPEEIAKAWNIVENRVKYFWRNREHGITTFQDESIEEYLSP